MPDFNDIDSLLLYIKKDIDKALAENVAPVVKEHISDEVINTVYSAGIPLIYQRRGENGFVNTGSLGDPNEMESDVINGTLTVEDNADFKDISGRSLGTSLAEVIEYGTSSTDWWNEPRSFMENAEVQLEKDSAHVKAMKKGLEEKGYRVI